MDFYQKKYLKYKTKYLDLLNQQGSSSDNIKEDSTKEEEEIIKSIKTKLSQLTTSSEIFSNNQTFNLHLTQLKELNNLLDTKKDLLNSLKLEYKENILRKPFHHMFKILLLTKDQINRFFTFFDNQQIVFLNLSIYQINNLFLHETHKRLNILNMPDIDVIEYILSKDFKLQNKLLKYKYKFIQFIMNIIRSISPSKRKNFTNELMELSQNELRLLEIKFTLEDISKFADLSLSANKIKQLIELSIRNIIGKNLSVDEIKKKLQNINK
jgi:hypothetical protein